MIVYERNYLEILQEICNENIREILRIYDYYKTELVPQLKGSSQKKIDYVIDNSLYLSQEAEEANDDSLEI